MSIAEDVTRSGITAFDEIASGSAGPIETASFGCLRVIVLNAPRKHNALSVQMRVSLNRELSAAAADSGMRVIVICGAGQTFCSGIDRNEPDNTDGLVAVTPNPAEAVRRLDKPVIAAVDGVCMTGGLELALGANFIIATDRARFADTHARIGAFSSWGMTAVLPRAIGSRRATQMMLSGEFIDARRAFEWGLLNEVTTPDSLFSRVIEVASMIEGASPRSIELQLHLLGQSEATATQWAVSAELEEAARASELRVPRY
jgi:enoyl-CoA hydratase